MSDGTQHRIMRPRPLVSDASRAFWDGVQEHRLILQRCRTCGSLQYPPTVACEQCRSIDLEPDQVSGDGEVYSFAIVHHPMHASFVDAVPYVVAMVELVEQSALRMISNVVNADPDDVVIGMPVHVTFDEEDGWSIPVFEPITGPR